MLKRYRLAAVAFLWAFLGGNWAVAGIVLGDDFNESFSAPPIIDLSDSYSYSEDTIQTPFGNITDFEMEFTLTQDVKGVLTGSGSSTAVYDGFDIDVTFQLKGKVKGSASGGSLKLTAKGSGFATDPFDVLPLNFKGQIKADILPTMGPYEILGLLKGKYCAKPGGCVPFSLAIQEAVDDDGAWRVGLTISQDGTKIFGTANILHEESAQTFAYLVKGKLNENAGTAKIGLKPTQKGPGNFKLDMTYREGKGGEAILQAVTAVNGKLLGWKVKGEPTLTPR